MKAATVSAAAPAGTPTVLKVRRATRASYVAALAFVVTIVVLAYAPYLVSRGVQTDLVTLFALITLGSMWNLMAGYAGMVSIGQQAYIGIGAYGLVYLADELSIDPFIAVPVAVGVCGLAALPLSYLVFRLVGGYFAIGTWVVAEVVKLLVTQVDALGGGSGISLTAFGGYSPGVRIAYVYWLSLLGAIAAVVVTYLLMRSRLGLGLTAIRDDAVAAGSLGVRVTRSRRIVYVVASMGCGLAGGMIATSTLRVQPESIFSVDYSAFMIFIVVIGGIGTIEGPILGAVTFFALQQWLSDLGVWYLVILGVVAIVITITAPKGLWGVLSGNGRIRLFPVGYSVLESPSVPPPGSTP